MIWFAFLGPAAAWALQLVVGYGLEEAACAPGSERSDIVEPVILVVTVIAAVVAITAGVAGFVLWRRAGRGSIAFMAAAGAVSSPIFLVFVLLAGFQLLGLDACVA